jgi:uncharacterized protein (TIGR02996 family)
MSTFTDPHGATLRAFLQAVKDDCDNDAPRLVLADWLDEQGDSARAELLRLQCGGRPCLHRRRVEELLAVYRYRWHGPLPPDVQVEFRRGLFHVQMTAERLLWDDFPPALRQAWQDGWVDSLCLTEVGHLLSLVAQSEWLANLTALDLSYSHLDDDVARLLAASPHLGGLAHLDLGYNPVSEAGERALLEAPGLRNLKSLRLDSPLLRVAQELRNRLLLCRGGHLTLSGVSLLHDSHVELLATAPQVETLTSLDLGGTHLTDSTLSRLLDGRRLPRLNRLVLRGNLLTDLGADILAASAARLPVLSEMDLSNNRVTESGAGSLARAGWPARLRMLDLRGNPIAADGLLAVQAVAPHPLPAEATTTEADPPAVKPVGAFPENFL